MMGNASSSLLKTGQYPLWKGFHRWAGGGGAGTTRGEEEPSSTVSVTCTQASGHGAGKPSMGPGSPPRHPPKSLSARKCIPAGWHRSQHVGSKLERKDEQKKESFVFAPGPCGKGQSSPARGQGLLSIHSEPLVIHLLLASRWVSRLSFKPATFCTPY